jgi:hypothetical protein
MVMGCVEVAEMDVHVVVVDVHLLVFRMIANYHRRNDATAGLLFRSLLFALLYFFERARRPGVAHADSLLVSYIYTS